jgi:hypothetical protein
VVHGPPNNQSGSESQSFAAGQCLVNGQFETIMQTDGNLVTYDQTQGTPVWASGTVGNPGAYLTLALTYMGAGGGSTTFTMKVVAANGGQLWSVGGNENGFLNSGAAQLLLQSNGNLQFSGLGVTLWQSGTASTAYSLLLEPGKSIISANGLFQLTMQTDGNLVEYLVAQGDPLWSTGTQGNPGAVAAMQDDGNLVVYSEAGTALWASGTSAPNTTLTLQGDGNLVIYGSNSAGQYPVWSSHTNNIRGYELTSGQLLQPGQYLVSQNHQYVLKMSGGGDLSISSLGQYLCPMWSVPAVTTSSSQAFPPQSGAYLQLTSSGDLALWRAGQSSGASMWDTGTSGGETAVMQNDGDLVVYSATGTALWSSGTSSNRGSYLCAGSTLSAGQHLAAWNDADTNNVFLQSSSSFSMQTDCNLVLYNSGTVVWASNTDENQADPQGYASGIYGGCYAVMQTQGNLVVYAPNDGNKVLWASGTQQAAPPKAVPPIVGPVFLIPIVGTTKQSSVCIATPNSPCPTVLSGTPDIYSSAGPLLGDPSPATSGGIAQWIVRALNTLVFFSGVAGDTVSTIDTVLGAVDTGISDIPFGGQDSGGTSGQASAAAGNGTGPARSNDVPAPVTTCTAGSPDQLVGGGQLAAGGCLYSPNGQYALVMQPNDGNLVLYKQSQGVALWASGTVGNPGAYLRLQADDGNLVETNQAGTAALWSTGTSGTANPALILGNDGNLVLYANGTGAGTPTAVWSSGTASIPPITSCVVGTSPSVLRSNQVLASGGCLRSANGQYALAMQTDGNLVLYYMVTSDALWATGTVGNPGAYLRLQSVDGNLVESNQAGTAALWSTGIPAPRANLTLQNDGNLVLTANNEVIGTGAVPYAAWSTSTQTFRGSTLPPGQVLQAGQYLQNGPFRLTMGATGLLVLSQTTAASTLCPMWTMPTTDASLPDTSYDYTGLFSYGFVSTPPTPGAYLAMQTQGNLVLYPPQQGASAFWATPTASPGAALTLSSSGTVAVQAFDGTVLWQALAANDEGLMLCAGGSLSQGQYITGDQPANSTTQLVMQSDCNLVIYVAGTPTWSSNTDVNEAGQGKNPLSKSAAKAGDYNGCYVQMQTDGNFVMYAPAAPNGAAMWASNSEQSSAFSLGRNIGPYYVTTGSDGYARMYNLLGTQLWDAGAGTSSGGATGAAGQKTAQTIFEILQLAAFFVFL